MDNLEGKHQHKDMHTVARCQDNHKVVFKLLQLKWKQFKDSNSWVSLKDKLHRHILHVTKMKNMQPTFCLNQQWRKMITIQVQVSLNQCSHQINNPLAVVMAVTNQAVVTEVTSLKEVAMAAMDLHLTNDLINYMYDLIVKGVNYPLLHNYFLT